MAGFRSPQFLTWGSAFAPPADMTELSLQLPKPPLQSRRLDVRPAPVSYRLELVQLDGREERRDMTSLSGSYSVGDLIQAPTGECWQVVGVEPEEDGPIRLICDPC
jgi:hypothetical protein